MLRPALVHRGASFFVFYLPFIKRGNRDAEEVQMWVLPPTVMVQVGSGVGPDVIRSRFGVDDVLPHPRLIGCATSNTLPRGLERRFYLVTKYQSKCREVVKYCIPVSKMPTLL